MNGHNMCTLYFALNDPTMNSVLLRNLGAMEALEIEFDAYEARRNNDALKRMNLKLQKFVSKNELAMMCKHLHILDQCQRSPVIDVKVVAQIMGGNSITVNGNAMRPGNGMNAMHNGIHGNMHGNMPNAISRDSFSRGGMGNSFGSHGMGMHPGPMSNAIMGHGYPRG